MKRKDVFKDKFPSHKNKTNKLYIYFDHPMKKGKMHSQTNPLHIKIKQIKYTCILTTPGKKETCI